ncbi:MAG: LPS export ABC transporter periplasmic protein LptC [Candidatus Kapabacteria bacterium]|nr:LPS export ABC transporter periplasmic protein LptC [Candidatus Kapabacteria bacterium]
MKFLRLIILYIFIFIVILLNGCGDTKETEKLKNSDNYDLSADQISWDVKVFFYDSSFTKAILKADKARIFANRAETWLNGNVKVNFFSKDSSAKSSVLTSDSARVDDRTKDMRAMGNVVVISEKNHTRLETSVLYWDNKNQKLYSTEFVKITAPKEKIQGYGFESDQNLNNYRIFKVSGEQK